MRRKATPEQIAKAKEKRAKVRELAKRIAAMSETERAALVQNWPTTIEGHALSLKNACLLAYQGPTTVVGGFRQWKKAGRFVKKGEAGKSIWIPLMRKTKDANGDEINEDGERPGFGLASVWDISQTEEMTRDDASGVPIYTEPAADLTQSERTFYSDQPAEREREPDFALAN